eukprot:TRINITY_DN68034_c9_g4_i1.p1 TRINITY_DN68034_c9_g4~~TRINITY_DN68034_c9_g4_i1.p1  ORF type:complete len:230 (+),score=4.70 TRINITY_DN68034_c9_g4_i1:38-727(+)
MVGQARLGRLRPLHPHLYQKQKQALMDPVKTPTTPARDCQPAPVAKTSAWNPFGTLCLQLSENGNSVLLSEFLSTVIAGQEQERSILENEEQLAWQFIVESHNLVMETMALEALLVEEEACRHKLFVLCTAQFMAKVCSYITKLQTAAREELLADEWTGRRCLLVQYLTTGETTERYHTVLAENHKRRTIVRKSRQRALKVAEREKQNANNTKQHPTFHCSALLPDTAW